MATTRTQEVQKVLDIMAKATLRHMSETGCTLEQAMTRAARWLYQTHPVIAAAVTVEFQEEGAR